MKKVTVELHLTVDQTHALSAAMLQAYNIMTDPEEYFELIKHKFTYEFRQQQRKNIVGILHELGWQDPSKTLVSYPKK